MNKKTKLMLVLLSAATVTAGALGIAACSDKGGKEANDPTYYAEYQTYVEGRKEAKEDYLGYQEWLTIKLFKEADGNTGANGKDGAAWLTGAAAPAATDGKDGDFYINTTDFKVYSKASGAWTELGCIKGSNGVEGEDGVGVESVEYVEGKLVVTLTNGETKDVELPAEITHKHAYNDEEVTTLVEPGADYDGVGYKTCTTDGCEHIELVILTKRYLVKVVDIAGDPIEGAEVKINGVTETTDKNGYANIYGYGYKNDYVVGVIYPGFVAADVYRTDEGANIEVTLAKQFGTRMNNGAMQQLITGEGTYTVSLNTYVQDKYNQDYTQVIGQEPKVNPSQDFVLIAGSESKKFKITPSNPAVMITDKQTNGTNLISGNSFSKVLSAGNEFRFYFNADAAALEMAGHNFGSTDPYAPGDPFSFTIKVEELDIPDAGTEELPITINANEEITLPAGATEPVYYGFANTSDSVRQVNFNLTGCTAEFKGWNYLGMLDGGAVEKNFAAVTAEQNITLVDGLAQNNGFASENVKYFIFRVTPTQGAAESKFTLNTVVEEGTLDNLYEVAAGTAFEKTVANDYDMARYAKLSVAEEGTYVVSLDGCQQIDIADSLTAEEAIASFQSFGTVELKAGTYYLAIQGEKNYSTKEGNYGFTIRKVNETADAGKVVSSPKAIELNFDEQTNLATFTTLDVVQETITYYEYAATKAGILTLQWGGEENDSLASYCKFSFGDDPNGELVGNEYVPVLSKTVALGEKVLISAVNGDIYGTSENKQFAIKVQYTEAPADPDAPVAHEHTIKVVNSEDIGVAGLTVKIKISQDNVITGVTDAEGIVKVDDALPSFISGVYPIEIPEYDKNTYYYETVAKTTKDVYTTNVLLRSDKTTYDFTAKTAEDEQVQKTFNGATIEVYNGSTKVASGEVADGKVSLGVFLPTNGTLKYTAILPDADAADYGLPLDKDFNITKENKTEPSKAVEFVSKKEYSLTVTNADGAPAAGITVNLSSRRVNDTAVTDGAGKVSFKLVPANNYYTLSYENLPAGYNLADLKIAEATYNYSLQLARGDKAATGATNEMAAANPEADDETSKLVVGLNAVTNTAETGYYLFTAESSGTYSFVIADSLNKGYIETLSLYAGTMPKPFLTSGRAMTADNNMILGANRGVNKAYEVSLEVRKGEKVVIGYKTGTGMLGTAFVTVTKTASALDLEQGANTVALTDGKATCAVYVPSDNFAATVELSCEVDGVTFTVDGQPYADGMMYNSTPYTIVITAPAGVTSVDITVTLVEPEEEDPMGPRG